MGTSTDAIKETMSGADYVISMSGGPMGKNVPYPEDLLLNFYKIVLPAAKEVPSIKTVFIQSGNMAFAPGEKKSGFNKFIFKVLVKGMLGLDGIILDHEAVMRYVEEFRKESTTPAVVVTRPPGLGPRGTKNVAVVTDKRKTTDTMAYTELALFIMDNLDNADIVGTNPFLSLKAASLDRSN